MKHEMIFYRISELMLAILIQGYDKKTISSQLRETKWNFSCYQVPYFKIVLVQYINLLNVSWIIKSLVLKNMEPLKEIIRCPPDHPGSLVYIPIANIPTAIIAISVRNTQELAEMNV